GASSGVKETGSASAAASASPAASGAADAGSDSAAKPLTKAHLTKAMLKQGDLDYQVRGLSDMDSGGMPIAADDDVCAAVSMMMLFSLSVDTEARVGRSVSATSGNTVGTGTSVMLTSYHEADAK